MFSNLKIITYTGTYSEQIQKLKNEIQSADAILLGAGAGLSASAGLTYCGERFDRYFADFRDRYGIRDMYAGGFYPYATPEEYWAWWSRHIWYNRYAPDTGKPYADLLSLMKDKDFFVLTTNVDHQFQKAGFDKKRLFYTQGDYGLWQCVNGCKNLTFDNEKQVKAMLEQQKDMRIPSALISKCPYCGEPLTMNLRSDDRFVQDAGWYAAADRYGEFLRRRGDGHILYLELGVGENTPGIIKYPFWRLTAGNPKAVYACINQGGAYCPETIAERAVCIDADIKTALESLING